MDDPASDDGARKLLEIQALIAEQRVLIEAYRAEVNTIHSESSLSDRRETHDRLTGFQAQYHQIDEQLKRLLGSAF